jgi:hypothetical protein
VPSVSCGPDDPDEIADAIRYPPGTPHRGEQDLTEEIELIESQIAAVRNHDLEGFLSFYAEDIKIRDFDGNVLLHGRAAMRVQYEPLFRDSLELSVEVPLRITAGEFVIEEENISGFILAGFPETMHAVVIYRVRAGLIRDMTFLM